MTSINTIAAHAATVARMGDVTRQLDSVQGQISTGRRVTVPSDDPLAFARASALRRETAAADAAQRAIDAGNRRLTASDIALESLGNLVQRGRELALQAGNDTLSAADRSAIATEVREIEAQARRLAETRDSDGQRLFAGAIADRPAYGADAAGVVIWQGGGAAPAVAIGDSAVASGSTGPAVFGASDSASGSRDLFATLTALRAALAMPDAAQRQDGVSTAIADLDGHDARIAAARGTLGARLGRLDGESERLARDKLATAGDLSRLEDLDMPAAIARLQRLSTVLQAAQASFAKVASLSLWDALR